ncbi:integrase, catalytic region, zinc finger, CCHC-type containing protein [Tanacetum coccineum]
MKNKIRTSRKWHKWFEHQSSFNWSPKSSTAQTPPSVSKSNASHRTYSRTLVTKKQWVAKLSTLPSGLSSCGAGTVRFGNDNFATITGYGDYVQGNLTICYVYYVEGLEHILFSVDPFCDGDLEVAFRSNTCYVRNLEGEDLLTGSRDSNLYTTSIPEMAASSPVCLMSKATPTKSWLWHRRFSHLNFGTINQLSKNELVDGFPRFKYDKDHLCSAPGVNYSNFQDSSEEMNDILSQQDLDNLFGPLYEEYYAPRTLEVSDNYDANTLDNEDTPSSSSIIVEDNDASQIATSSEEPIAQESSTQVLDTHSDEQIQEDDAEHDGNTIMHSFGTPALEEAESSSNYQDPSNMHEFHQQHRYTDRWTKIHPLEQVIGDPSKPVTTRSRLRTDAKLSIESMQDELNHFKRLDVRELVPLPKGRHVIKPDGFVDPDFSNHVYRLKKAMYGLKHAPQAWYDKLSSFLIEHHFTKARIDADLQGTPTDQTKYRSTIGGLMYLTASRRDIAFATFVYARYQARPTEKHLKEVKRIFRYLRQSINMGLWYSKDSRFELIAYSDADHAGCHDDCKSTSGGIQFLGDKLVSWSSKKQDCTAMSTVEIEVQMPYPIIWYNILVQSTSTSDIILSRSMLNKNIPCSMECKIIGKILIDHALSYALTATTNVPAMYIEQFWKTVKQVSNANDTIRFTIDRETITYTVDMFRDTRKLPMETPANPFIEQQKKDVIQYPRFTKIIIIDLMKKFPSISQSLEENYHSIKDDIPLVSVYTTGNVAVRGMLILVESTQGTNRTPRATRTPTLTTEVAQKKHKSKAVARESSTPRKSLKVTIKQKKPSTTLIPPPSDDRERDEIAEATYCMVEGEEDEESYASEFADSVFQDDNDDSGNRKKYDKNNDNDHADHTLVKGEVSDSLETRNEQTQTPISSPSRSPRTDLSLDKTLFEELMDNVSPTPDTTSKDPSMSQRISSTNRILPGSVAELCRRRGQLREQLTNTFITKEYFEGKMKDMSDTLNNLVPELTVAKTNELIKEAIPRMVNDAVKHDQDLSTDIVRELVSKEFATHAPKIIKELFKLHMKNKVLNVHPTISISTIKTTADLKQQLYLKMKTDLQA